MSPFHKREWSQLVILAIPFIAIAVWWNKIPERVPTHWNYDGRPDHFGGKGALFFLPLLNIGIAALVWGIARINPKTIEMNASPTILRPIRLIVTTFISVLFIITLLPTAGFDVGVIGSTQTALPALFFVIGAYLQSIKPENFLTSQWSWPGDPATSQRLARSIGRMWMALSASFVLIACLLNFQVPLWLFIVWLSLLFITPIVFLISISVSTKPVNYGHGKDN